MKTELIGREAIEYFQSLSLEEQSQYGTFSLLLEAMDPDGTIPFPYGTIEEVGLRTDIKAWWARASSDDIAMRIMDEALEPKYVYDPHQERWKWKREFSIIGKDRIVADFSIRMAYCQKYPEISKKAQIGLWATFQYWAPLSQPKKSKYRAPRRGFQRKEWAEQVASEAFYREITRGWLRTYNPWKNPLQYLRGILSITLISLLKSEYSEPIEDEEIYGSDYSRHIASLSAYGELDSLGIEEEPSEGLERRGEFIQALLQLLEALIQRLEERKKPDLIPFVLYVQERVPHMTINEWEEWVKWAEEERRTPREILLRALSLYGPTSPPTSLIKFVKRYAIKVEAPKTQNDGS